MPNPYDLLFLDEDGAAVAPVAGKKSAAPTKAGKPEASVKSGDKAPAPKGRMEGEGKGRDATRKAGPRDEIESAAELPARPRAAKNGGRQASSGQATRNYDRHSRSGQKEGGEKRQYAGKGNWGNPRDAVVSEEAGAAEGAAVADKQEDETTAAAEVVEEKAPAYVTLEQYLAEQEKKKPAVAAKAPRAANDGAKIAAEVITKTDNMYFQTKSAAPSAQKAKATKTTNATASAKTTFSLQELNAALPGGINRPPRPAREESASKPQQRNGAGRNSGRRYEDNKETRVEAPRASFKANLKDASAFPSL